MSCSPVVVQLGVKFDVLAVHFNSLCVKVYGVTEFFLSIFFVTFILVNFCYS